MYGMEKTTVYLPAELKRAIKRLARQQGRSEADLIREALARVAEGRDAPAPRLPLFRSRGPSIAERVDEALAAGFGRE
jgi:Arc/MetJ-type ribon-helix-helix transcriptional regulator